MSGRLLTLQDVSSARGFYAAGHWRSETLYGLLAGRARLRPEALALRDAAGAFTYRELLAWVDGLGARLHDAGLGPGDRVAIWCASRMESVATLLACSRMGYVAVPSLHRDHTPEAVEAILDRTRAAAMVIESGFGSNLAGRDTAAEFAAKPGLRAVFALDPIILDAGPELLRYGGLVRPGVTAPCTAGDPDRISYLPFTSGTTGEPKGVMHTDNTLLANARAVVSDFGFSEETVVYTFSPMSHNMGTVSLATTLACGGTLVLHAPVDAPRALRRVVETGATYLVGVPTHGLDLMEQLGGQDQLGLVRVFQLAGSPVPVRLAEALIGRGVQVQNCYGMTENCSFLYTRAGDPVEVVTRTCGRPAAGMEIRVLDPDEPDRPLPDGQVGELAVRGVSQMLGYFDDQATTEASHNADGWFLTGDLGRLEPSGPVRVTGRKKDLILRGGKSIHPAQVEALAELHPDIGRAAAFPVPDARLGEKMCLAIVRVSGVIAPQPQEILAHLARHGLSRYHMPEYLLEVPGFPMTASGKILKRELTARAKHGDLEPVPVRWTGE